MASVATAADRLRAAVRWGPLVAAGLATATLWTLVDRWWWLLPLGYGPRWPWLALPLLPLLAGGPPRRRLIPAILTLIVVLWGLVGFRIGRVGGISDATGDRLRLVAFNAAVHEAALAAVLHETQRREMDILLVVECPRRAAREVTGYRLAASGELCVWSRSTAEPVIDDSPRDPALIGWSGTIATVTVPGSGLAPIGVVHLRSVRDELEQFLEPSTLLGDADSMEARRSKRIAGSIHASAWFRALPTPPEVVVGDFNLVVESSRFRADWGHWRDAFEAIGSGTGHTWRSRWYGLRIDHVLYRDAWRPVSFEIAPPMGSDHRALLVELAREPQRTIAVR